MRVLVLEDETVLREMLARRLREAGLSYGEFQALGYYLTVTEVGARYHKPACYDELVTVRTWLGEVHSRGMRIDYEIVNAAGQVLVTGFTKHICITHDGKPARLPEALASLVQRDIVKIHTHCVAPLTAGMSGQYHLHGFTRSQPIGVGPDDHKPIGARQVEDEIALVKNWISLPTLIMLDEANRKPIFTSGLRS